MQGRNDMVKAAAVMGFVALSCATIGLFGGTLLSEQFGPEIGWPAAMATAVLFAIASIPPSKAKRKQDKAAKRVDWGHIVLLVASFTALIMLSGGLGLGRTLHGLEEAQWKADVPRIEALAKQEADIKARAARFAVDLEEERKTLAAAMAASGQMMVAGAQGRGKPKARRLAAQQQAAAQARFDRKEAELRKVMREDIATIEARIIPERKDVTLANLSLTAWAIILALVVFELGFGVTIKVVGHKLRVWMDETVVVRLDGERIVLLERQDEEAKARIAELEQQLEAGTALRERFEPRLAELEEQLGQAKARATELGTDAMRQRLRADALEERLESEPTPPTDGGTPKALEGVELNRLDVEALKGLDVEAGTWRGMPLGEAKARRIEGASVLWPTIDGEFVARKRGGGPSKAVFVGTLPARRLTGNAMPSRRRVRTQRPLALPLPADMVNNVIPLAK